jgi:hypothetical protein
MKNQFADPALPTLADVAAQILKAEDLSVTRKASVRSAIAIAGRWFNMPPSAVPAKSKLSAKSQKWSSSGLKPTQNRPTSMRNRPVR